MWAVQYWLVLLVVTVLIFWYLSFIWKRRKWYIYSWNTPGPLCLPVIGASYKFIGNPEDILETLDTMIATYPSITVFWLGTRLIYCLTEPDHVKRVLTSQKCLEKDHFYKFIAQVIGTGLFTAPVEKWRKHRRIITPSFSQKILDSFVEIFAEQTAIFVGILKDYEGKSNIDIVKPVAALTMDIICESAMGLKMNTQLGNCEFATNLERLMEITTLRIFRVWHHLEWTWRFYPASRQLAKHRADFQKITLEVIEKKMRIREQEMKTENSPTAQIEEGEQKKRLAFLDLILNSGFTREELREEVEIFLIGGTDTASITVCFFLEMMGMHQEIQQKVYEEAIEILGEDRPVEVRDLPKLTYIEMALRETMRLFPIGAFIVRTVGEDIKLGKYVMPEGASAFISVINIHRNAKYWPDPLKFDPDRFLPEEVAKRHPCCYLPFSYGPRSCIELKIYKPTIMGVTFSSLMRYQTTNSWTALELLLVAFSCTLLAWYLQLLWSKRKLYECSNKLPGPLALPFIGSVLYFIGSPYNIFCNIMKMFREYPGIFRVWYGSRMFYAVSDPKYYEILLPVCLRKEQWYDYAVPIVGQGLFTAPYEKWRRHRKIIMPTFNQKILDSFVEIFSEQSEILVGEMKKNVGKGDFDVFSLVYNCTLDIICETAMGVRVNVQTSDDVPISTWMDRLLEITFLRCFVVWYHFDAIFNMTPMSRDLQFYVKKLHNFCTKVVRDKKRTFDESRRKPDNSTGAYFEEGCKRKAFLDYLIEVTSNENSKFTEGELKEEVITFIVAGSDTTACTNSFVFVMLGLHKDLQERVYQEILEVVGPTRAVDKDDLAKLKYMDIFIKETLRLFPVGGFIVRAIDEDVDLGDYIVPAGISVIFGILRTHTNEEYWPDPFGFDPDRFLPEEVAKRPPCSYLPFSYGPRNCIGMKYAMMAMKALLATVLRKFKVSTPYKSVQDIKLKANMVLRPKDGYMVSLELR